MNENRKDEHVKFALRQETISNDFDKVVIEHVSIPNISVDDINLATTFLDFDVPLPFYINAMTGGSFKTLKINENLAKIAKHYNIPLVLGSASNAIKDNRLTDTYTIARNVYSNGIIVANVSANATVEDANKAIEMIDANALSIHVNVIQELAMSEGDRNFTNWQTNIGALVEKINIPIILKEVGFGFSLESLELVNNLGIKHVDVSGKGGTNFAKIEGQRAGEISKFWEKLGISTVDSLLNAKEEGDLTYYASGGINDALDIVKSLILGAKSCGLSKYFLHRSMEPFEKAIKTIDDLILDIKKIMVMLNVKTIKDLENVKYKII